MTAQHVCVPGYAKKVRAVPARLKRQAYAEYGITQYKTGDYEVDHLIPLSMRTREGTMTRDEFNEEIILDTLRRFMLNSDLSDRRISRLMGIEIETLRTLVAGTANPRKQSLNKVRSFLKWHGRKDKDWLSDYCRGFLPDLCD